MTAPDDDLWRSSATEIAGLTRSKQVSCREVVEAHLRRIEAVDPAVNAVVVHLDEQSLDAADAADRLAAHATELPPLHGVPVTVKESIDLVGTPTTQGARVLADAYPPTSSPDVERLVRAGAIPIGRTNVATLAVRWHCESELWGSTVNPWNRDRTPGASSGGVSRPPTLRCHSAWSRSRSREVTRSLRRGAACSSSLR